MKGERHVGGEIRVLSNLIKRCMDDGMPPETTGMQGWIIGFLHRNEDRDMIQRDVEAEFNIRRSTATGILQLMEKNGFLLREPVAYDARLKKLVLTPKALAVHEGVISRIRATEERITKDVTPEELEQFFAITTKFRRNLERVSALPFPCRRRRRGFFRACRQRFSSAYIVRVLTVMVLTS